MNFKKTLGLVLTAALVSSSLVAVKPVKAATTAAPVAVTATNSALTKFNYFFAQRSLLVAGEADTYVVDTDYSGKVQYELWVKKADDANAKWTVVSADGNGKVGYTDAVDGQNSPYAIKLKDGFKFDQGKYYTAVYAKVANTDGKNSKGHFIDANGVDTTDTKSGTEQKYDIYTTGYFNAIASKGNYNEMLDDFLFSQGSATVDSATLGQTVTFNGFASQKSGAKYKLVVRELGKDASTQTVVNPSAFEGTIPWTPVEAGTYEVIAWSAPDNNKTGARDGWAIDSKYFTVNPAATKAAVDPSSITLKTNQPILGESLVTLKLTGVKDPSTCTVTFGSTTLKYYASTGAFSGVVSSTDETKLKDATSYTVTDNSTPVAQATIDASSITLKTNQPILGESLVTLKLTGVTDASKYTVAFGSTTLKYYASTGAFSGVVSSTDENTLKNVASYTVTANAAQ